MGSFPFCCGAYHLIGKKGTYVRNYSTEWQAPQLWHDRPYGYSGGPSKLIQHVCKYGVTILSVTEEIILEKFLGRRGKEFHEGEQQKLSETERGIFGELQCSGGRQRERNKK